MKSSSSKPRSRSASRSSSPSRPRLATLATERLAAARLKEVNDLEDMWPDANARASEQETIDALGHAIRRAAQRRKRRRVLVTGLAVSLVLAASVLLLVGSRGLPNGGSASPPFTAVARSLNDGSVHVRGGRQATLGAGASVGLQGGDRVIARTHAVHVELSTGTRLSLEPSTEMAMADDLAPTKQAFMLHAGRLHADVAKLAAGQRFIVRTSDAEIEVRGTSFRVESGLAECAGSTTRVRVSEGVVVVRSVHGEARVGAGAEWPMTCESMTTTSVANAVPVTPSPSSTPTPLPPVHVRLSEKSPPASTASTATSELADQNRMYGEATSARRLGANAEAIRAYERFLTRYPNGQLAESAAVERMRLLATSNGPLAASAARDYLQRYPHGFARDEATKLANGR